MGVINVNGRSYDNGTVTISFLAGINYEITELDYSTDQDHKENYSLGSNDATSYQMGSKKHSCTVGMRLSSINKIEQAAGGSLLEIKPFDIVVTYVNEWNIIVTDIITCKFKKLGRKLSVDDDAKYVHEMFVTGIEYNV